MYEFIKREEGCISHEEVTGLVKKHIADHDWKSVLLLPPISAASTPAPV